MELTLVLQSEVKPWHYPPMSEMQYGEWLRDEYVNGLVPAPERSPDLAPLITMVLAGNHPLFGPPPAEVLDPVPIDDGAAEQVFFVLDVSPIKDEYTLAYQWDGYDEVTWTLVEGKMLRALDGAYVLRDLGNGSTEVTYRLSLDVSIPLIGMLKRKAEKMIMDTALNELKRRVETAGVGD